MINLRKVHAGERIRATDWNALVERVRYLEKMRGGEGITVTRDPAGMRVQAISDPFTLGIIPDFIGTIVNPPQDETNYQDERYWVREQYVVTAADTLPHDDPGHTPMTIAPVTDGRVVTVTNMREIMTASHLLTLGEWVLVYKTSDSTQADTYFMEIVTPGACNICDLLHWGASPPTGMPSRLILTIEGVESINGSYNFNGTYSMTWGTGIWAYYSGSPSNPQIGDLHTQIEGCRNMAGDPLNWDMVIVWMGRYASGGQYQWYFYSEVSMGDITLTPDQYTTWLMNSYLPTTGPNVINDALPQTPYPEANPYGFYWDPIGKNGTATVRLDPAIGCLA